MQSTPDPKPQSNQIKFDHTPTTGIAFKITAFMSAMVLIAVGSIGFWTYHLFNTELVEQELDDLRTDANIAAVRFSAQIQELKHDVIFLSGTPPIQGIIRAQSAAGTDPIDGSSEKLWRTRLAIIFNELLESKAQYLSIRYLSMINSHILVEVNKEGFISNVEKIFRDRELAGLISPELTSSKEVYLSPIHLHPIDQAGGYQRLPTLTAATPIFDADEKMFGILIMEQNLAPLLQSLQTSVTENKVFYVIDQEGRLLSQSSNDTPPVSINKASKLARDYPKLSELFTTNKLPADTIVENNGKKYSLGQHKVTFDSDHTPWSITFVMQAEYDDVVKSSNASRFASIVVSAIILPVVLLAGLLFSRSLTRPLMLIVDATQRFSRGETNIILPTTAGGEAGKLARAFDNMMRHVHERNASLLESEVRLRTTVNTIVDGLITINTSGHIESFNPGAENIFGYQADEVIGKNINCLMPEPYHSEHDKYLSNYLETGQVKIMGIGREVEGMRKDGSVFPLELSVSEMCFGDQRKFTGIVRNITERKKIDRMKNEFISTVSHELRTPLTSIRGSLGLVASGIAGELPNKAKELISIAESNSERLVRLINDILDIEKIESGKMRFDFRHLDLSHIIEKSILDNQGFAKKYDIHLSYDAPSETITVNADPDRINQVITNLLSNAIKYSPEGGEVKVRVKAQIKTVEVWITDQGSGIPAEFHSQLFEKFSQADASDTRPKGGTGLGLNIAKAIIEKHHGSINFLTHANQGTSFYFDLPRESAESIDIQPIINTKPNILICEDDRDIARLLEMMLQESGYNTHTAYNAKQAQYLLRIHKFDAMTLDLALPGQDGIQLIKILRADAKTHDLPIIVVSAQAVEGKSQINGNGIAVADWLDKPIDQRRLINAVRHATTKQSGNQAKLLYVEDDTDMQKIITTMLSDYAQVTPATSLSQAREYLKLHNYDLLILDLSLPDGNGLELLPLLNELTPQPPVIIFSAYELAEEQAKLVDDALVKSQAGNQELIATIRNLLTERTVQKFV